MRHSNLLLAALVSSALASACAAGDQITPPTASSGDGGSRGDGGRENEGGSNDGGSSNEGGRSPQGPGPGGNTTTSSPSSSSGSSSDGGSPSSVASSSTGSPCSEDPCKLVSPQCGCGVDEKCSLEGDNERACFADGTRTPGQECSQAIGDCEAGALCVYLSTAQEVLSCARFCETDAECEGQGGLCALGLTGVDDVRLCSDNCDPLTGTGCAIANTKCSIYAQGNPAERYYTGCTDELGDGVLFESCSDTDGCAVGFECLQELNSGDLLCFQWCNTAASACPDDLACAGFSPALQVGAVTYGVCSG